MLIRKGKFMSIDKVLVIVQNKNEYSIKVALSSGGIIEEVTEQRHIFWINNASIK